MLETFHITVDVFSDSDSGKCDLSVTSSEIPPLKNERLVKAGQLRKLRWFSSEEFDGLGQF